MIRQKHVTALAVIVGLLAATSILTVLAAPGGTAAALAVQENNSSIANNSEYYNGTADVQNESWFAGINDASLDSMGKLATRFGTYFIGTGSMDSSGTGFQGVLLTGLVMGASMLGAVAGIGVGPVGGSVFAVVIGFGMTEVGLAPAWFRVLLLFGIGIIAFVSLTNVLEAR